MTISKIITLTSAYDHRIIQGAKSGEFLRQVHELRWRRISSSPGQSRPHAA